jgi:adenylate kinase
MKLILLGAPGSGKGTQSKLICKAYKLKHISPGEILRREIKQDTKEGSIIKPYVDNGKMAPDAVVFRLIKKALPKDNYLIDGFPRNHEQLKNVKNIKVDKVIFLKINEKTIKKRLIKRRNLENRADDSEEAIKTRIKIYKREMPKVLKFYKNKLTIINANQSIKKVYSEIKKIVTKVN